MKEKYFQMLYVKRRNAPVDPWRSANGSITIHCIRAKYKCGDNLAPAAAVDDAAAAAVVDAAAVVVVVDVVDNDPAPGLGPRNLTK